MSLSLPRLDLTQIFCEVDDFYREFERLCERNIARLPCDGQPKSYQSTLSISEVMTIVIAFHANARLSRQSTTHSKISAKSSSLGIAVRSTSWLT